MSITVRLWTDADLEKLSSVDNLLTVFFNSKTIEEKGLGYFRRLLGRRKTYHVYFNTENGLDSSEVYAASDTSLRWFLNQEYDYNTICYMEEVITTYREVTVLDIKQQMQSELTADEAIALSQSGWWVGIPVKEAALLQLNQSRLCMDSFSTFHGIVEEALGRPVYTHEFASAHSLVKELEQND